MELLMQLEGEAFTAMAVDFKQREKELNGSLPLIEFIRIMLRRLPRCTSTEDKKARIGKLIDLFNDIDINGDSRLEFDEFTSYCVTAGMVHTRTATSSLKYFYQEQRGYVDRTTQGDFVNRLRWLEKIQCLLTIESEAKSIKVYSHDCVQIAELKNSSRIAAVADTSATNLPTGGLNFANTMNPDTASRIEMECFVLDVEYIPTLHQIVSSSSDFALSFWDADNFKFITEVRCQVSQSLIKWCSVPGKLLGSDAAGIIYVWETTQESKRMCKHLIQHSDVIMDILEVPEHDVIVSGGLDHKLLLWDTLEFRPRGQLVGHTRGIRQMVYSASVDLLFSTGFEFDAFAWDLSSRQILMRLSAHRSPLVGVQVVQFRSECLITADEEGNFKLWSTSRSKGSSCEVLETFSSASNLSMFRPRAFTVVSPRRNIVAGGCTMHIFKSVRIQVEEDVPVYAMYNRNAQQFVAITSTKVSVYDAQGGELLKEYEKIHESDIIHCCTDTDNRKLITSTQEGTIAVFSCVNFNLLSQVKTPMGTIRSIMYSSPDKIIIAVNDEGSVHVFDAESKDDCPPLRSAEISGANRALDAVFSYNASLIAIALSDSSINLLDFETLNIENVCRAGSEIGALEFIDPLPLIAGADGKGNIFFYVIRPHIRDGQCVHAMHMKRAKDDTSKKVPVVSCMKSFRDEDSRYLLITGDDAGGITIWDMTPMVNRLKLEPIPDDKVKWKQRGFNPRNRIQNQAANQDVSRASSSEGRPSSSAAGALRQRNRRMTNSLKEIPSRAFLKPLKASKTSTFTQMANMSAQVNPECWEPQDIFQLASFEAHEDMVKTLEVFQHPNAILSTSLDYHFKLWDWEGNLQGSLNASEDDYERQWNFACDSSEKESTRAALVEQIMRQLHAMQLSHQDADAQDQEVEDGSATINPLLKNLLREKHQKKKRKSTLMKKDSTLSLLSSAEPSFQTYFDESPIINDDEKYTRERRRQSLHQIDTRRCYDEGAEVDTDVLLAKPTNSSHITSTSVNAILRATTAPAATPGKTTTEPKQLEYANLEQVRHEQQRKASSLKAVVDIEPSSFLSHHLKLDSHGNLPVLPMQRSPVRRPKTTSGSFARAGNHRSAKPQKGSLSKLNPIVHNHRTSFASLCGAEFGASRLRLGTMSSIDTSKLVDSKQADQQARLNGINDIINRATASEPSTSPPLSEKWLETMDEEKKKSNRQKMQRLSERFSVLVQDEVDDSSKKLKADLQKRRATERALKEKRMRKYLLQKQKNVHSNIGDALRKTSMLYHSSDSDRKEDLAFGVYSTKQVMSVIRLFWSLDTDNSGTIGLDELIESDMFSVLGLGDPASVFQSLDLDGSGDLNLIELLTVCFTYATRDQINGMLDLSKIGKVQRSLRAKDPLSADQKDELRMIFKVFDKDNSGTVSLEEVMDMLVNEDGGSELYVSKAEIERYYNEYDVNGDHELDEKEFIAMLQGLYTNIASTDLRLSA